MSARIDPSSGRFVVADISGRRFGRLLVINRATNKGSQTRWLCRCDCGATREVYSHMLKKGTTVSCGCYNRERSTTHGHARGEKCSTTYNIWCAMNQRCTNPKVRMWPNYGGRGIRVCDRWLESFENFLTDMGERPSAKHSIDRYPNNDGNYEPGNCRWATVEQQARNKRNLRMVEYHGETKSLVDWCDQLGVDRRRAWKRLYRGWTPERAFATA